MAKKDCLKLDLDILYSKMYACASLHDSLEEKVFCEKWSYLIELTNDLEAKRIVSINDLLNQKMYLYRCLRKVPRLISDLIENPIDFCNELIILAEIWNIAKDNNIIKVLLNFNNNSKIFLACYFHRFDSYIGLKVILIKLQLLLVKELLSLFLEVDSNLIFFEMGFLYFVVINEKSENI